MGIPMQDFNESNADSDSKSTKSNHESQPGSPSAPSSPSSPTSSTSLPSLSSPETPPTPYDCACHLQTLEELARAPSVNPQQSSLPTPPSSPAQTPSAPAIPFSFIFCPCLTPEQSLENLSTLSEPELRSFVAAMGFLINGTETPELLVDIVRMVLRIEEYGRVFEEGFQDMEGLGLEPGHGQGQGQGHGQGQGQGHGQHKHQGMGRDLEDVARELWFINRKLDEIYRRLGEDGNDRDGNGMDELEY